MRNIRPWMMLFVCLAYTLITTSVLSSHTDPSQLPVEDLSEISANSERRTTTTGDLLTGDSTNKETSFEQATTTANDETSLLLKEFSCGVYEKNTTTCLLDPEERHKRSCEGRCGAISNTVYCQCDPECAKYGDCCTDYTDMCNPNECNDLRRNSKDIYDCFVSNDASSNSRSVYLVVKCPSDVQDSAISAQCQARDGLINRIPVVDMKTGENYRNKFCALCHGVVAFEPWNVSISCESEEIDPSQFISPDIDIVLDLLHNPACIFESTAPINARPCISLLKDCKEGCNGTEMSETCATGGQNPVRYLYRVFYNIYCLQCNHRFDSIYDKAFSCKININRSSQIIYRYLSFSLLVDMDTSMAYGVKVEANEVFGLDDLEFQCDGIGLRCEPRACPIYHTKVDSKCLIVNQMLVQVNLSFEIGHSNSREDKVIQNGQVVIGKVLKYAIEIVYRPLGYIKKVFSSWDASQMIYESDFAFNLTAPSGTPIAALQMDVSDKLEIIITELEKYYERVEVTMALHVIDLEANDARDKGSDTKTARSRQYPFQARCLNIITILLFYGAMF